MISALDRAAPAFDIVQGTVTARDRQPTVGHIARGDTHALLTTEPEIWILDAAAKEHHFKGHQFDNAREGHVLIVVRKRKDGKVLRVCNQSTMTSFDAGDLVAPRGGAGGFIWSTIGLAGVLIVPTFIAWLAVVIGLREMLFGVGRNVEIDIGLHFRAFLALLLGGCAWLTVRMRASGQAAAKSLSADIDAALERLDRGSSSGR